MLRYVTADVNQTDAMGQSALHVACMKGNAEAASFLMDQGAMPNMQDLDGDACVHFAKTPEVLAVLFDEQEGAILMDGTEAPPRDVANPDVTNNAGQTAEAEEDRMSEVIFTPRPVWPNTPMTILAQRMIEAIMAICCPAVRNTT